VAQVAVYKTHKYSVGRTYNCWMLNLLMHRVTRRLNPISHLLALLGARPKVHISRIKVKILQLSSETCVVVFWWDDATRIPSTINTVKFVRSEWVWWYVTKRVRTSKTKAHPHVKWDAIWRSRFIRYELSHGIDHPALLSCDTPVTACKRGMQSHRVSWR
jgi:hypothetical protein